MSATNRALPIELTQRTAEHFPPGSLPVLQPNRQPALRLVPLLRDPHPRRFLRVPTHAVGVLPEQREYPRASLKLPLRLRSVNSILEEFPSPSSHATLAPPACISF